MFCLPLVHGPHSRTQSWEKTVVLPHRVFGRYLGLREVMKLGMVFISSLTRRGIKKFASSLFPLSEDTAPSQLPTSQKESLHLGNELASTLILDFSVSWMVRNTFPLFKPPNACYFVMAACAKTTTKFTGKLNHSFGLFIILLCSWHSAIHIIGLNFSKYLNLKS